MTAPELAAASAVMAVGAAVQGVVGFGANLVAAPLLVLLDPDFVPGPVTLTALVLNVALLWRERGREMLDRAVSNAIVGLLPGTLVAAVTLAALPRRGLTVTFAVLVLLAVVLSASGLELRRTRRSLFGAGVLSGFMGTVSGIGGPPVALVYQRASGAVLRGTLPSFFLVSSLIATIALVAVDKLGRDEFVAAAALVPGVLVGLRCSRWLAGHLDGERVRPVVLCLSGAAAVSVVAQALL